MRQTRKTLAAVLAATLIFALWTLPVQGVRRYDACARDYASFGALTQDIPADVSLIVKTDGTLPDFRATHPVETVQGPDDTYVVRYADEAAADEALACMEAQRGVDWAELNVPVYAQTQTKSLYDPYHDWGVKYIGADVFNAQLRAAAPTDRVTVAVADSGIYLSHPVFDGRNITGTSMTDGYYSQDDSGHGTAVAGVIADCTTGLPVDLMILRILNSKGEGTSANTAAAIRYAADNGADIINLSIGAENHVQVLADAVAYALEHDCLPVISAGNYGKNLDVDSICPSHDGLGVIVSGCAEDDSLYKKTCYGGVVDVCAPAVNVTCAKVGGGYTDKTGTSFAAPYACAAAAMLKLLAPSADARMLEYLLKKNVRDVGSEGFDVYYGFGVLDLRDVRLPAYTLTLDAADGVFADDTSRATQRLTACSATAQPAEPTREGYTFFGYMPQVPAAMPFGDLTCTALWLPDSAAGATIVERDDPTCLTTGYIKAQYGSQTITAVVPALGHSYSPWQQTRAASQYREGEECSFCTRCADVRTRSIDLLPGAPLTLKETTLRLRYKTSFDLEPSETVTWTVGDESVVTVSPSGVVYAAGRGRTTVTAQSVHSSKSATCSVTVYYAWWQWIIRILLGGWLWY